MPTPHANESRDDFLDRCMSDPEARTDFPERDQRFAFCQAQFTRSSEKGIMGKVDTNLNIVGQVTKLDNEQRLAYGWFSVIEEDGVPVVDSQGDIIKADTLTQAVHHFVVDSREGKLMHKGRRVADLVESLVFTKEVQAALGITLPKGRVGWFGAFKFRDEEAWQKVKKNPNGFSIGGTGQRISV